MTQFDDKVLLTWLVAIRMQWAAGIERFDVPPGVMNEMRSRGWVEYEDDPADGEYFNCASTAEGRRVSDLFAPEAGRFPLDTGGRS